MRIRLVLTALTIIFLLLATTLVVLYGKGYRLTLNKDKLMLAGTGLLVATSTPDGASVFLNGRLTSATNTTLNLPPASYDVRIVKDGYLPWEKSLTVQKEIVTKVEALLLPRAPKLESLTSIGANQPLLDPTATRIAFTVTSSTPKKNGIYLLDMAGRPILSLQNAANQIADDTIGSFSGGRLLWSPSGKELIATISANTYLLIPDRFNQTLNNISQTLPVVKSQWDKEKEEKDKARLASLPKSDLAKIVKESFQNSRFSPDETKILYSALTTATIPQIIVPPLPGTNSQKEERTIREGKIYVYDIKEDKNFLIRGDEPQKLTLLSWMPDSKHLVFIEDQKINIIEYDGTNKTAVYSGPFDPNFVAPWPDGSKLVILTNLGATDVEANLYTISLR